MLYSSGVCVGGNAPLFEPKKGKRPSCSFKQGHSWRSQLFRLKQKEGTRLFLFEETGWSRTLGNDSGVPRARDKPAGLASAEKGKRKRSPLGKIAERDPARSKRLRKPRYPTASGRGRPAKGFLGKRPLVYLRPSRRPSPSRSRRRTAAGHQAPRPWTCPGTRGSKGSARYQMTPPPSRVTRTL